MIFLSDQEVARALQCPEPCNSAFYKRVSIDSRLTKPGDLFVAIRGEHHDGHQFVQDALEKGATGVIVESLPISVSVPVYQVQDSFQALWKLARWVRTHQVGLQIIGITGSVGKTTVKEMIRSILEAVGPTAYSHGNLNNFLGTPLSLCQIRSVDRYGVFEMGMNQPGEISQLSHLVQPHMGVITPIGPAHLAGFSSIEEIVNEKTKIVDGMAEGGWVVTDHDGPFADAVISQLKQKEVEVITVGKNPQSLSRLLEIKSQNHRMDLTVDLLGDRVTYSMENSTSFHMAFNSLLALTTMTRLGINWEVAVQVLSQFRPVPGRGGVYSTVYQTFPIVVIDDCYNANPLSTRAALHHLAQFQSTHPNARRVAVLGDMLELGEQASQLHFELGEIIANLETIDYVITVGALAQHIQKGCQNQIPGAHFEDLSQLSQALPQQIQPNDIILFKASRGTRLRSLVQEILSQDL
jgi:UDP-N-acetylmuramoyl-tripeptide--D-alanyl-D-alanine ligase